jgi:hypothetical protein
MILRPELIAELRQLMLDGTTLSGLVGHIVEQHPQENVSQSLIRAYLMEAFSIPFHERIRKDVDSAESHDFYARANLFFLPEFVAASVAWHGGGERNGEEKSWLDSFRSDDFPRPKASEDGNPPVGISEASWAALSPSERERIGQMESSERTLVDRALILAHLAERLQRKIAELQKQPSSGTGHAPSVTLP